MTMLEKAARAAAVEIAKIRRTRIPAFPGSWKTYEGLGFDNLDEVSTAVARAVVMAVREPSDDLANKACQPIADTVPFNPCPREAFTAMIDAILNEGQP